MARILIVEDDLRLATFTQMTLEAKGHSTYLALTGGAAQHILQTQTVDLILLDLDLPDISGVALCKMLRQNHVLPILIFSAEGQVGTKVEALEAGANDYIVKPIDIRELLARVTAQLNAVSRSQALHEKKRGNLCYHVLKDQFSTPLGILTLPELSHQILLALFQAEILSKAALYAQVWAGEYLAERDGHLIEVQISRLRKQLKQSHCDCQIISVYGKGYYLALQREEPPEISLG